MCVCFEIDIDEIYVDCGLVNLYFVGVGWCDGCIDVVQYVGIVVMVDFDLDGIGGLGYDVFCY